jgi:hypothetical protein
LSLLKNTLELRAYGLFKIPLLFICNPTVENLSDRSCTVRIPLNYWTRNHLKSMYFGALAMGADCAGGYLAMNLIRKSGQDISLIFKDFKAEYFKRAEDDVHFTCQNGPQIKKIIAEAIKTGKRVLTPLVVIATTPKKLGDEPVARFELGLSLKAK